MVGVDPLRFLVAVLPVWTALPVVLAALAGGAVADIVDRRRLLIAIQTMVAVLVAGFGLMVWRGHVTPALLLGFSFLGGTAAALIAPVWMTIVPQLVPRQQLQPAGALHAVAIHVSRAAR